MKSRHLSSTHVHSRPLTSTDRYRFGQTLSMRVKYRRRYPDRELARMWFVSDE